MKRWNYGVFYKLLLNLVLFRRASLCIRLEEYEASAAAQWREDRPAFPKPDEEAIREVDRTLLPHYAWADNLAVYYAGLYRTAFICKYLLGFLVVFGVIIGVYGNTSTQVIGFTVESLLLISIICLTKTSERRGWHDRFLDYRLLAEHLRHMRYLSLLGDTLPAARPPLHDVHLSSTWVNWHFRNIVREAGLVDGRLDKNYLDSVKTFLEKAEIGAQEIFYKNTGDAFRIVAGRLDRMGLWCFYIGFIAVVCRLVLHGYGYFHPAPAGGALPVLGVYTKNVLNLLITIIPSLAPVLFGLKSHGEFGRLAKRYEAMADRLEDKRAEASDMEVSPKKLRRFAEEISRIMINEVSDWKVLLKARPVSFS